MRLTPEQLFERYTQRADPQAMGTLFDRIAPELLKVAAALVRDRHRAEDLVQTTFLVAIESAAAYRPGQPLLPWLLRILANRARYWRRRDRRARQLEAPGESREKDPQQAAANQELGAAIRENVRGLPEPYRQVLILHLENGLTAREIAVARNQPRNTVRSQITRGMEMMRRALPAGFAASTALIVHRTGLAGVRQRVLAAAGARVAAPSALALALLPGAWGLALTLVVVTAVGWLTTSPSLPARWEDSAVARSADLSAPEPHGSAAPLTVPEPRTAISSRDRDANSGLTVSLSYADDGAPGDRVGVYLRPTDRIDRGVDRRADRTGTVEFEGVPPGRYILTIDRAGQHALEVPAVGRLRRELEIPRGVVVRVRVLSADGTPAAGARIYRRHPGHADFRQLLATTGDRGDALLRDVAPGLPLLARCAGHQPSAGVPVPGVVGDRVELVLRLGMPAREFIGRVLDAAGRGAAHALVGVGVDDLVRDGRPARPAYRAENTEGARPLDREFLFERADRDGRFRCTEAPAGQVLVVARHCQPDDGWIAAQVVDSRDLNDAGVTLQLQAGARIHGRLLDETGRPAEGFRVTARWEGDYGLGRPDREIGNLLCDREVTVGVDGRFLVTGLFPGRTDLRVSGRDRRWLNERVVVTATEHLKWSRRLVAPGGGRHVRVVDADGRPCQGYRVGVIVDEPAPAGDVVATDLDGRAYLPLVDGAARVVVYPPGGDDPGGVPAKPTIAVDDVWPSSRELIIALPRGRG